MQYGVRAAFFGTGDVTVGAAGVLVGAAGPARSGERSRLPSLPAIDATLPPTPVFLSVAEAPPRRPALPAPDDLSAFGLPCGAEIVAEPVPPASVRVRLSAPCMPNERVVFRHEGLVFATTTSALGLVDVTVPAMTRAARIEATLPDDTVLSVITAVSEIGEYKRVALASSGRAILSINAFEFGAAQGEAGHVRFRPGAQHRASPARGHIVRLGDPDIPAPLQSEVYTFPAGQTLAHGSVRLHVEAEVTERTCGRPVEAAAIQTLSGGPPTHVALTLDMPGCDAVGDILVLKNVLRDLRIARN